MTLSIERKKFIFSIKEVWFADEPYDIKGYDILIFVAAKNKVDREGFSCREEYTRTIDLTKNIETILGDMRERCRRYISQAKRQNIRVKINQNYEEFFEIDRAFRKVKGLKPSLLTAEFLKNQATLLVAEQSGEILAGQFLLEDKNNIRGIIGASKRFEVDKEKTALIANANRLIFWEAIQYAKEKGIKEFDLGGYYMGKIKNEQKEGINFFKEGFGGQLAIRYNYQKDYSKIYLTLKKIYHWIR